MEAFKSNQRFKVVVDEPINMADVAALTTVYLPIIGRNAYTLYMALFYDQTAQISAVAHVDLMDQLALNTQSFLDAREQLEGLGLLQSYEQTQTGASQWVYRLYPPMSIRKFLSEHLLASLLAHYVGEDAFEELVANYGQIPAEVNGRNVSKSLFDVIAPDTFDMMAEPPVDTTGATPIQQNLQAAGRDLDLNMMSQMLKATKITAVTLRRSQEDLVLQKHLYGLTDLELVRAIQQTLSLDGDLDVGKLADFLGNQYRQTQQAPRVEAQDSTTPETLPNQAAQHPLIAVAQADAPLQFLAKMRDQNNGIVTDNEQRMITELVKMKLVPDEVLNIAMYELTAVEKRSSLNKNLLQTVVNDWAQAGVRSAQDALRYLAQRSKANQARSTSVAPRQRNWQGRPATKETRPDWENQQTETVSDQELKDAQAALARLKETAKKNQEG
jgi:replication initiation and membrane attachment protein